MSGCSDADPVEDVILALHERLARSPAMLVAATVEDMCAVPERPNIPGSVSAERPNWSLALPQPIDEALSSPLATGLSAAMLSTDRSAGRPSPGRPTPDSPEPGML
jgi:4-alpha-glucanotransferase